VKNSVNNALLGILSGEDRKPKTTLSLALERYLFTLATSGNLRFFEEFYFARDV